MHPIDWRCWWITWEVEQAIHPCSVCRPVGWAAPIRPDIKKTLLDHIGEVLLCLPNDEVQWWSLCEALVTDGKEEPGFWIRPKGSWMKFKDGAYIWLKCLLFLLHCTLSVKRQTVQASAVFSSREYKYILLLSELEFVLIWGFYIRLQSKMYSYLLLQGIEQHVVLVSCATQE